VDLAAQDEACPGCIWPVSEHYDLIVLDIMLQAFDGYQCVHVWRDDAQRDNPIIHADRARTSWTAASKGLKTAQMNYLGQALCLSDW